MLVDDYNQMYKKCINILGHTNCKLQPTYK